MKNTIGDIYIDSSKKEKITRTVEIISSRFTNENKQYLLSTTEIFNNGNSKTRFKRISPDEFRTHIKTGNWHQITASHSTFPTENSVMVQITEHFPIRLLPSTTMLVKSDPTQEEFSRIKKR